MTDTVLDASLPLSRERSARGLAEQGVGLLCTYRVCLVAVTAHEVDLPADVAERIPVSPRELEPQVCAERCVLAIVNPFTL